METCTTCKEYCLIMTDNTCADCYWEEDARQKRIRRSDPKWIFSRAYSFAKIVMGQTHEQALLTAEAAVKSRTTSK